MSGFTVRPKPAPRVLAVGEEQTCDQRPREKGDGVYCERPEDHRGGHLSESHRRYWPAEEPRS